jgi:hypothetical protein
MRSAIGVRPADHAHAGVAPCMRDRPNRAEGMAAAHRTVAPASNRAPQAEWRTVASPQRTAFDNGLRHTAFDSIVDKLDEWAGARTTRVDAAAFRRQGVADRLDARDTPLCAASHDSGVVPHARWMVAGAEIDEADAALLQGRMAADGNAPIGDDVARLRRLPPRLPADLREADDRDIA